MAASPMWKVYDKAKVYQAACKEVELAAALVAFLGEGATIRCEHALVLWTEGKEGVPASESYDHVVEVVHRRLGERRAAMKAKLDAMCAAENAQVKPAVPTMHHPAPSAPLIVDIPDEIRAAALQLDGSRALPVCVGVLKKDGASIWAIREQDADVPEVVRENAGTFQRITWAADMEAR